MLELTSRIALLEIGRIAGSRSVRRFLRRGARLPSDFRTRRARSCSSYGRLCGLAGDVGQYLACAERAQARRRVRRSVRVRDALSAGPRTACGRPPRSRLCDGGVLGRGRAGCADCEEAVGRSTAPGLCRVWWALASAHLGHTAEAEAALGFSRRGGERASRPSTERTHSCARVRLRGDLPGALAHGRRAVELAEERGSVFSRVEAAAFLGAAEARGRRPHRGRRVLERALALARSAHRAVVRAAHPRDARGREAGRR